MTEQTGERFTIKFLNRSDVCDFAARTIVPRHVEGRKSIDTEKWILSRYLLALANAGLLDYPLTVIHAAGFDSPDFMLYGPDGAKTGLETTEASTSDFHRELICNELSENEWSEADLRKFLATPGSMGDEQERLWSELALSAIRVKDAKLGGGNWNPADAYDLVIYDNGPATVLYPARADKFLREKLGATVRSRFRTVSIVAHGITQVLYDVEGSFRSLPIVAG